jgi:hypothetical protein
MVLSTCCAGRDCALTGLSDHEGFVCLSWLARHQPKLYIRRQGVSTKNVDPMTPAECRAARGLLGITQSQLAGRGRTRTLDCRRFREGTTMNSIPARSRGCATSPLAGKARRNRAGGPLRQPRRSARRRDRAPQTDLLRTQYRPGRQSGRRRPYSARG